MKEEKIINYILEEEETGEAIKENTAGREPVDFEMLQELQKREMKRKLKFRAATQKSR